MTGAPQPAASTAEPTGATGTMSPRHVVLPSPIGELTVVAQDGAVTHLLMDAAKYRPADLATFGDEASLEEEPFAAAAVQLQAYFAGELRDFDLPLAPRGDEFQQRVWALLRAIPYGETRSYGDLARSLGDRNLAQAVGSSGLLDPVAAAWLPNGVFLLVGLWLLVRVRT